MGRHRSASYTPAILRTFVTEACDLGVFLELPPFLGLREQTGWSSILAKCEDFSGSFPLLLRASCNSLDCESWDTATTDRDGTSVSHRGHWAPACGLWEPWPGCWDTCV